MKFSLLMPGKILFGCGESKNLHRIATDYGRRFLIVAGRSQVEGGAISALQESLDTSGCFSVVYSGITGEPTPDMVQQAADLAVLNGCDAVIGLGGGSVIDAAKAAAGIATNGGPVIEYLEGVGIGRKMTVDPLPFLAVPTTSGTGAEATKNAVISDRAAGYKASFRSDKLMAKAAVIDPELTLAVPPTVTAWSGMDALTQLMESYLSKKAQPVTDALALSGMRQVAAALVRAFRDGGDVAAREAMAYGSHLSGICLANSGLGADHGIAAALGAVEGVPHGLACAVLLPHVMRINMPHAGGKAAEMSLALTGKQWKDPSGNITAVTEFVEQLSISLNIPARLGLTGIDDARLQKIAKSVSGSSMSGNPVELSNTDVMNLIRGVV